MTGVQTVLFRSEKLDVRFGVFLCTPRHDKKFRVALLWRKDTSSVKEASDQFGKILFAAQLCAAWREQLAANDTGNEAFYQYLGPNCCRIGTWVSSYFFLMESIALLIDFYLDHSNFNVSLLYFK